MKIFQAEDSTGFLPQTALKILAGRQARLRSLSLTGLISSVGFAYRAIED